jgi:hypothetical protein
MPTRVCIADQGAAPATQPQTPRSNPSDPPSAYLQQRAASESSARQRCAARIRRSAEASFQALTARSVCQTKLFGSRAASRFAISSPSFYPPAPSTPNSGGGSACMLLIPIIQHRACVTLRASKEWRASFAKARFGGNGETHDITILDSACRACVPVCSRCAGSGAGRVALRKFSR